MSNILDLNTTCTCRNTTSSNVNCITVNNCINKELNNISGSGSSALNGFCTAVSTCIDAEFSKFSAGLTNNIPSFDNALTTVLKSFDNYSASGDLVLTISNDILKWSVGSGSGSVTSITAGSGMDFTTINTTGSVIMGTPSNVTLISTNSLSSTSHTHAFAPGGSSSQVILGDGTLGAYNTGTLSSTQIGFGNGSNLLTGSSNFTYNGGSSTITVNDNTLIVHGVGNANGMIGIRINNSNSGVSAGSALALYNNRGGINGEIVIQTTSTGYNAFGVSPDIGLIHTTTANGFQVSNFYATPISFGVGGIGGGNIVGQINGITGNWVLTNGSYTPADNGNKLQVTGNQSISGKLGIVTGSPTAVLDIDSDTLRLRTARTITTSVDAGNGGDMCWDSSYIYVCISTNVWKRTALSTW